MFSELRERANEAMHLLGEGQSALLLPRSARLPLMYTRVLNSRENDQHEISVIGVVNQLVFEKEHSIVAFQNLVLVDQQGFKIPWNFDSLFRLAVFADHGLARWCDIYLRLNDLRSILENNPIILEGSLKGFGSNETAKQSVLKWKKKMFPLREMIGLMYLNLFLGSYTGSFTTNVPETSYGVHFSLFEEEQRKLLNWMHNDVG